ncbi:MAG TPA: hypothetical protein VH207_11960, partial [Chthoniobacterales bacterium]|nr:hypothetical protein [Chthoniobacterales bacterium]
MHRAFFLFVCGLLVCLTTSFAAAAASPPAIIALKATHLFDGKSKTLLPNGVVVVEGNRIVAAGSNLPVPNDARVIELGDATLSPGFMDAHTHLTFDFSGN